LCCIWLLLLPAVPLLILYLQPGLAAWLLLLLLLLLLDIKWLCEIWCQVCRCRSIAAAGAAAGLVVLLL
jgi:hypothetical protein